MNSTHSSSPAEHVHYDGTDFPSLDDNVGYLIKMAHQSILRMLDQDIAPMQLTASQWRPLALLASNRASSPVELAKLAGVDCAAMTRSLDRMQAKGLIERTRCPIDRRVVRIELTETGQEKLREIPPFIARALNQHLQGFSDQEVQQLLQFLRRMIANGTHSAATGPGTDGES